MITPKLVKRALGITLTVALIGTTAYWIMIQDSIPPPVTLPTSGPTKPIQEKIDTIKGSNEYCKNKYQNLLQEIEAAADFNNFSNNNSENEKLKISLIHELERAYFNSLQNYAMLHFKKSKWSNDTLLWVKNDLTLLQSKVSIKNHVKLIPGILPTINDQLAMTKFINNARSYEHDLSQDKVILSESKTKLQKVKGNTFFNKNLDLVNQLNSIPTQLFDKQFTRLNNQIGDADVNYPKKSEYGDLFLVPFRDQLGTFYDMRNDYGIPEKKFNAKYEHLKKRAEYIYEN
jgi:hypothetical protein